MVEGTVGLLYPCQKVLMGCIEGPQQIGPGGNDVVVGSEYLHAGSALIPVGNWALV